jgi:hypothetical protein
VAEGWCQGATARDDAGDPISPLDPGARSWSVLGALVAFDCNGEPGPPEPCLRDVADAALLLARASGFDSLRGWNDAPSRRQSDVLALFDLALGLRAAD